MSASSKLPKGTTPLSCAGSLSYPPSPSSFPFVSLLFPSFATVLFLFFFFRLVLSCIPRDQRCSHRHPMTLFETQPVLKFLWFVFSFVLCMCVCPVLSSILLDAFLSSSIPSSFLLPPSPFLLPPFDYPFHIPSLCPSCLSLFLCCQCCAGVYVALFLCVFCCCQAAKRNQQAQASSSASSTSSSRSSVSSSSFVSVSASASSSPSVAAPAERIRNKIALIPDE